MTCPKTETFFLWDFPFPRKNPNLMGKEIMQFFHKSGTKIPKKSRGIEKSRDFREIQKNPRKWKNFRKRKIFKNERKKSPLLENSHLKATFALKEVDITESVPLILTNHRTEIRLDKSVSKSVAHIPMISHHMSKPCEPPSDFYFTLFARYF